MPPESPVARELTRRLLAEAGQPDDDAGAAIIAARDALECVSTEFSRWIGVRGFDALMSRVLADTRSEHPALDDVSYQLRPEPGLTVLGESFAAHGTAATARALEALLQTTLALLTRLIGEDLVVTFVERSMDNRRRDENDRSQNPDHRSVAP